MEPRIQYAQTKDRVSIAFATYGEGQPVVWSHQHVASHVQLEWQQPLYKTAYSVLAAQRMLVRFDARGAGLSDRDVDDLSLDARLRDLEAVADHLKLSRFALLGVEDGGLTAMSYAARHPDRVSHLVLINCFARPADVVATPRAQTFLGLVDDWEMLTENVGAMAFGYGSEEAKRYGEFIRACITPETFVRWQEASGAIDLTGILPQISVPTLVVRHSGLKWVTMDNARELAARIPNARIAVVEGMYQDNFNQLAMAVGEFLGLEAEPELESFDSAAVQTMLFTDIEGSTALTQRLGDARARELLRQHERIVREALRAHGGAEVKTMGDGFMASFSSATRALECAIALQRAFAEWNTGVGAHGLAPLRVRIGLNAGEPIAEEADLFGTAVIRAARIAAMAQGGEILVANVVRELAEGKEFLFADRGEAGLRGFEEPVRLYEVRWQA